MVRLSLSPGRTLLTSIVAFDDGLDTVAVQEDLVQQFKAVKPPTRAKQSFEAQVENILKAKATRLTGRPAHSHVRFLHLTSLFPLN